MKKQKIKTVTTKDIFKELEKERKRHPIYYFFHDIFWRTYHFIDNIPLNIRSFIQRGRKGWSSRDTWCFCYHLSDIIAKGLYHLKEHQHGYPSDLTEGQWIDILNKIIHTFELARGIADGNIFYLSSKEYDEKKYMKLVKLAKDLNKKYSGHRVLNKQQIKEYEEGWNLFREYFFSLWD